MIKQISFSEWYSKEINSVILKRTDEADVIYEAMLNNPNAMFTYWGQYINYCSVNGLEQVDKKPVRRELPAELF